MHHATASLEREHRVVEKMVRVVSILVDELMENRQVDGDILRDLSQFLRVYGDQCHHGKEESCLFPLLESRGVPEDGCPLGALRHEHERSRALTQALVHATAEYSVNPLAARPALAQVLRDLVEFYPSHIWKEEFLLFPMAEKVLSAQDDQNLMKEFASIESDIFSHAHESYEQLASDLEERAVRASPKMRAVSRRAA